MTNQYLFNLALIHANNFCKDNNIDHTGTHLTKYNRRQRYVLVRDEDGRAIVTVIFYKDKVPSYSF